MSKGLKTAVAVVLFVALGFPAYAGYELWTTSSKVDRAEADLKSARSSSQGWSETESMAQKELQDARDRARALSAAASARQDFDSSLEAAKEQLQLASGTVPIDDAQRRILAAQDQVLEKDADSKTIEDQTRELDSVTAELKERRGVSSSSVPANPLFNQALKSALSAVGEAVS